MTDYLNRACTAFAGTSELARGPLIDVALAVKSADAATPVLVFDDATGKPVELDLRGGTADIVRRLSEQAEWENAPKTRGRPKLGVVAREVTLLPRHWEWLAAQPGGASQALRRLVDEARRADGGQTDAKAARERPYRVLQALAGDLPGYEEAMRALFAGDLPAFAAHMADWPGDVRAYALRLAEPNAQP